MRSDEADDSRMPAYRARLLMTPARFRPKRLDNHAVAAAVVSIPG
jgi:hypothetical protein